MISNDCAARRYRLKVHSHQIKAHKNFISQAMRIWISFNFLETERKTTTGGSEKQRVLSIVWFNAATEAVTMCLRMGKSLWFQSEQGATVASATPIIHSYYADTLYMRRVVFRSHTLRISVDRQTTGIWWSVCEQKTVQDENSIACIFLDVHTANHCTDAALDI